MLHIVGFALMVSFNRDAEENKNINNQKNDKETALQTSKTVRN